MSADKPWRYALRTVLWWRTRPGPVTRMLGAGIQEARPLTEADRLRVAVVQMQARLYTSARDFALEMERWVVEAHGRGAGLIVFPEDTGTQLLGLIPGAAGRISALSSGAIESGSEPAAYFRLASRHLDRLFTAIGAELARKYRIYIVSGSIRRETVDGRLVNTAYTFDSTGMIVGRQEKLHLMAAEAAWGFSPGRALTIVSGPGFRLATAICHDAAYFETFRLALAGGADLVAVPAANPEEYKPWYARRGVWARVQETPVYGLASHLVGEFLGWRLTGRSGIDAPLALTPGNDGILAQATQTGREELVVADLDLGALRLWRAQNPPRIPLEVILAHLPGLYREHSEQGVCLDQESQTQQDGQEELAQDQDQESPPPTESQADHEPEVGQEEAPRIEDEQDEAEGALREEQAEEAEQVRDLSGSGGEQEQAEGCLAPEEAGEDQQDGCIDQPFQDGDEGGQQDQEKV